jgi:ATP-binding cassette subfamily F protein 3
VDEEDNSALRLKFPPAPRSGSYPVIAENLSKRYDAHQVFSGVNFTISRGDKVAFVGKNGEGKSTLVKCIMGEIPFDGKLELGHNVKTGYFAQNQAQLLDETLTVFETVDYAAVGDVRTKIRDILGAFMFGGDASDKKVKMLSGGERSRLAMIRLLLEPVNLLILDEPTNHLDMRSKDVLKAAIRDFDGTVIIVSHDREFLGGLVSKVYEFGNQRVIEHLGGIYDFLEKKKIEQLQELERPSTVDKLPADRIDSPVAPESKLSYEERKEAARALKRLDKQVAEIEREVETKEKEISAIEYLLTQPENVSNTLLYEKHGVLKKELEKILLEWERLSCELEKIKQ